MDKECFKVFLGGINESISEGNLILILDDLYYYLIKYGPISELNIMTDKKGCKNLKFISI